MSLQSNTNNDIFIVPSQSLMQFSGSSGNTITLQVEPSGAVNFVGTTGSILKIMDNLSGSLFSVNNISGLSILEVFSNNQVKIGDPTNYALIVSGSNVIITGSLVDKSTGIKFLVVDSTTGVVYTTGSGGGGGGSPTTPASPVNSIQYNNAGAFGGVPSLTYNGTTLSATGSFSGSLIGTASWANSASNALNAVTASYVNITSTNLGTLTVNTATPGEIKLTAVTSSASPAGASTELQYRAGASSFGAVASSSYINGTGQLTLGNLIATGSLRGTATTASYVNIQAGPRIQAVNYNSSNGVTTITGSIGGSDTQIQFNSGSTFSGSSALSFRYTSSGFQQGLNIFASGNFSHAQGHLTTASGLYSHAEGSSSLASGWASHAEGAFTTASGFHTHAEGNGTLASGDAAHAEGNGARAIGAGSHAEGQNCIAISQNAHAEGGTTTAAGQFSHSEGIGTLASGSYSHAEGYATTASAGAQAAHAEGYYTIASANYSHAEGSGSRTNGIASHAEGLQTVASGDYQHVQGQFNISSSAQSAFIIGNGTSPSARRNLIFASGSEFQLTGSLRVTGSTILSGSFDNIINQASDYVASVTNTSTAAASSAEFLVKTGTGVNGTNFYIQSTPFGYTGNTYYPGSVLMVAVASDFTGSVTRPIKFISQIAATPAASAFEWHYSSSFAIDRLSLKMKLDVPSGILSNSGSIVTSGSLIVASDSTYASTTAHEAIYFGTPGLAGSWRIALSGSGDTSTLNIERWNSGTGTYGKDAIFTSGSTISL
jgi:hypothetical protein